MSIKINGKRVSPIQSVKVVSQELLDSKQDKLTPDNIENLEITKDKALRAFVSKLNANILEKNIHPTAEVIQEAWYSNYVSAFFFFSNHFVRTLIVPNSYVAFLEACFKGSSVERIEVNGISRIEKDAFRDCFYLTHISIGSRGVTYDGGNYEGGLSDGAFAGCVRLDAETINALLSPMSKFRIGTHAFTIGTAGGGAHGYELVISENCIEIADDAFAMWNMSDYGGKKSTITLLFGGDVPMGRDCFHGLAHNSIVYVRNESWDHFSKRPNYPFGIMSGGQVQVVTTSSTGVEEIHTIQ